MAIRNTRLIIKNSVIPSQTLPSSGVLQGEGLINLGDGILFFSGGTAGSPTFVHSNNPTPGYFEVGSNLYQLKIRDKITSYSGVTDLSGKFLSGTTSGFVLADTSSIQGIDRYVTGATLTTTATTNSNQQTSTLNYNLTPAGGPFTFVTENTFTTGGTYNNTNKEITFLRNDGQTGFTVDLSTIDVNDTFVTGGTITYTGRTGTVTLTRNDNVSIPIVNLFDTYTTGFSYSNNTFTISDNSGSTFSQTINTVTGLTVNGNLAVTGSTNTGSISATTYNTNLGNNLVVYTNGSGQLSAESGFGYDAGADKLTVSNVDVSNDVVIQGSLTVFGPSVSAFTSNLYVEDPNITLNYNPTGNTTVTSVNSGYMIQDGNGLNGGNVNFDIVRMQNLTGLTATQIPNVSEYTALTGYANRGFITQLNDIVIRSTDVTDNGGSGAINGVRVLAEFDVLDGGTY
jgi:hypothetical protein